MEMGEKWGVSVNGEGKIGDGASYGCIEVMGVRNEAV